MNKQLYTPVRIILADDHEIFREGFNTLLNKQTDIELIGEAENGVDLVNLAGQLLPDVILTDIKMPGMDGIEATRKIISLFPQIYVIALTMFDEDNLIIDMLESGAKGYLLKNAHKNEVFDAIKTVYQGGSYFCKDTSPKLLQLISNSKYNPYKEVNREVFTSKEIEVIRFICQEFSNKEIAEKLHLSVRTIEGYRERIQEKMKVKNGVGIAVFAIKNGIYKIPA
ncbi:MAG: response regulator transcription factor [Bacteroidota bacterium]